MSTRTKLIFKSGDLVYWGPDPETRRYHGICIVLKYMSDEDLKKENIGAYNYNTYKICHIHSSKYHINHHKNVAHERSLRLIEDSLGEDN